MTTAEQIKSLKEERAEKIKEIDVLIAKEASEKRALSAEDEKKYKDLNADVESINARIKRQEEKEARDLENARTMSIVSSGTLSAANKRGEAGERDNTLEKWNWKRALNSRMPGNSLDGAEAEMDKEERRNVIEGGGNVEFHPNSVMVPARMLQRNVQRRDMDATTATAAPNNEGSFTIQTNVEGIVDVFLPETVMGKLPVVRMNNLRGNVQFPQAQTLPAAAWGTENHTATEKTPRFAKLNLSPKRLAAYVQLSNQLLHQSEANIGAFARRFLLNASAIGFEKAFLRGGGSDEPVGILGSASNYTAVYAGGHDTNAAGAQHGAAPVWADFVNLVKRTKMANASDGQAYVTSPAIRGQLQTKARQSAGSEGNFILRDWNSGVNGFPMLSTTNLADTFTKGGSVVLSAILFGDFSNSVVASWGGLEIGVDPYVNMKEALTNVVLNSYMDCGVLNPAAFAAITDAQSYT